jgi:hypothetical protein
MIDLTTGSVARMCDGWHRRDFLRVGALGLCGLTLADRLRLVAAVEKSGGSPVREKSVILLFLAGGPSQYETFDPKPDGPEGSTSVAGHLQTALPGVRFASYLNFPLILAGGEGMGFVQGRHVAFNGQTPVVAVEGKAPAMKKDLGKNPASVSDLLRTISERMGVEAKGFGESRRTLDELLS